MAIINALKTGNWSDSTVWPDGTFPTGADQVQANGYMIRINQNVTVASLRNTAEGGGIAGGTFTLLAGYTITGDIIVETTICVTLSGLGDAYIVGNIIGGSMNNVYSVQHSTATNLYITGSVTGGLGAGPCLYYVGSGQLNITGDIIGGAGSNAYGVRNSGTGILTIVGNVTGGIGTGGVGLYINAGLDTVIHGQAIGSEGGQSGIQVTTNGCNVSCDEAVGNSYGGTSVALSGAFGILNTSKTGICKVKKLTFGANGQSPVSGRVHLAPDSTNQIDFLNDTGGRTLLFGSDTICDYPEISDVRTGTVYDNTQKTGTCSVPNPASVAYGVPIDATTGTAALTPDAVWTHASRTLTAGGVTSQEIWEYATRTLTSQNFILQVLGDTTVQVTDQELPAIHNLKIIITNDFEAAFQLADGDGVPVDLTDWTVISQIRARRKLTSELIADFTVTVTNAENGEFKLSLTDEQTSAITKASGWYDVLFVSPVGIDKTYIGGDIEFVQTATEK